MNSRTLGPFQCSSLQLQGDSIDGESTPGASLYATKLSAGAFLKGDGSRTSIPGAPGTPEQQLLAQQRATIHEH
jgi:hypothetical protein